MKTFMTALAAMVIASTSALAQAWNPEVPYETDIVIGSQDAPVTVIEYASLTCPHCARFHAEAYPEFVEQWVDTGKAKIVFRHLPLDQAALAAAMSVSCLPEDARLPAIKELFSSINEWAPRMDLAPVLSRAVGDSFDAEGMLECYARENYPEQIMQPGTDAITNGVKATPTFFIGGEQIEGFTSAADLGAIVEKTLADRP